MPDPTDSDTVECPPPEYRGPQGSKPPKRTVSVEFGAMTHIGKVRDKNQDHFLVSRIGRSFDVIQTSLPAGELPAPIHDVAYGMAIADGMGGMAAGETASLLAIRTGVALVLDSPKWAFRIDENEARQLIDRMKQYFHRVDDTLIAQTRIDPSLTGMGTTLTVAYSAGADAFVVHAGDSRAYLFRDGALRQLTRDHTLESARHVLTNFAGGPAQGIVPEVATVALADGDRLLLCTDGLTRMVGDPEIAAVLAQHAAPEDAARALVDRALERGGRDNVTVVLARYSIRNDE